jgi:hypothetical protein
VFGLAATGGSGDDGELRRSCRRSSVCGQPGPNCCGTPHADTVVGEVAFDDASQIVVQLLLTQPRIGQSTDAGKTRSENLFDIVGDLDRRYALDCAPLSAQQRCQ